jgi:hypothetical protein
VIIQVSECPLKTLMALTNAVIAVIVMGNPHQNEFQEGPHRIKRATFRTKRKPKKIMLKIPSAIRTIIRIFTVVSPFY